MVTSKPHPGRSAGFRGFPCRPPLFCSPPLFLPSPLGLCCSPAGRPRCRLAAPAPSSKGEIAKLVAIMTLHSGRRLPLNVSAPGPAGPNQRAPPCCPPRPRPSLPPPPPAHKKWGTKPPRISPSLCGADCCTKPPLWEAIGSSGGTSIPTRWGFCSRRGLRLPTTPFVQDSNKKPFFPHLPGPEPPFSQARPHNGAAR